MPMQPWVSAWEKSILGKYMERRHRCRSIPDNIFGVKFLLALVTGCLYVGHSISFNCLSSFQKLKFELVCSCRDTHLNIRIHEFFIFIFCEVCSSFNIATAGGFLDQIQPKNLKLSCQILFMQCKFPIHETLVSFLHPSTMPLLESSEITFNLKI